LKFEPGDLKRVFKVVILAQCAASFDRAGIRIRDFANKTIEVRGLVRQHAMWGYEIVVTDPSSITVLASNEHSVA
jgi:hypothetical protein